MNTNERASTIDSILGFAGNVGRRATETISTTVSSPGTANGILQVAFYFLLYGFILFLVLLVIHYTITPVFRFMPGSKGIIPIPINVDSGVYWNTKQIPSPLSKAPINGDSLSNYPFLNNFSFSIDILARKLTDTNATNRIILLKGPNVGYTGNQLNIQNMSESELNSLCQSKSFKLDSSGNQITTTMTDLSEGSNIITQSNEKVSMIMYLTEVNDLIVTFFNNNIRYSSKPISNIPLYQPFRVSVVVETKLFTVYLNGKQVFQRIVPEGISHSSGDQRFYTAPAFANLPTQTIFVQNLILNPRVISYDEVVEAQPALALIDDFGASQESTNGSC
jgi:hypothetical protein